MHVPKVCAGATYVTYIAPNCLFSGAATTASRLGQPDLAIATMNDFVGVSVFRYNNQAFSSS